MFAIKSAQRASRTLHFSSASKASKAQASLADFVPSPEKGSSTVFNLPKKPSKLNPEGCVTVGVGGSVCCATLVIDAISIIGSAILCCPCIAGAALCGSSLAGGGYLVKKKMDED